MPSPDPTIVTTLDDVVDATDGETSLREAIIFANSDADHTDITFDSGLAEGDIVLDLGQLEITSSLSINGDVDDDGVGDILVSGDNASRVFHIDGSAGDTVELANLAIEDGFVDNGDAAAPGGGAGIFFTGAGALVLGNVLVQHNEVAGAAGSGGGLYSEGAQLEIVASEFTSNTAERAGGAVEIAGTDDVFMFDAEFFGNLAGNGGAIHVTDGGGGAMSVGDSLFKDNTATGEGGAIWVNDTLSLSVGEVTFDSNTAEGDDADQGGGAIFSEGGVVELDNVLFEQNRADGVSGSGGAVMAVGGSVEIVEDGASFIGNAASRAGGAIEINNASLTSSNSFFGGNIAGTLGSQTTANPGNGGAIHTTGASLVALHSSTYDRNSATNEGGALWLSDATFAIVDENEFWDNSAGTAGGAIFLRSGALADIDWNRFDNNVADVGEAVAGGGALPVGDRDYTPTLNFGRVGAGGFAENFFTTQTVVGTEAGDQLVGDSGANSLSGEGGNDLIAPWFGIDSVSLGAGADVLIGPAEHLDGDTVTDFTEEDLVALVNGAFTREELVVVKTETQTTLSDPDENVTLTLLGDFRGGDFVTGAFNDPDLEAAGTAVAFLEFLPELAEGRAITPPEALDKAALDLFLGGNAYFDITIDADDAGAVFRNAVGVYEIDSEGNIFNVRIIDADASDGGGAENVMVGEDRDLGLFIIQDGADFAEDLGDAALRFNEDGQLVVGESDEPADVLVFHATRPELNGDGMQHALAGANDDGFGLRFGFEDQVGLGDMDYQDVVLTVQAVPELVLDLG